MALLEDIVEEVMIDCNGLIESLATRHVMDAVREFCEKSEIYRVTHDAIDVVATPTPDRTYSLSAPSDTEIVTLYYALFDKAPLAPYGEEMLDDRKPYWRNNGVTRGYYLNADINEVVLTFDPTRDITDGLVVGMVLEPTLSASSVPDILGRYRRQIVAGALSSLKAMDKKPWSNMKSAHRNSSLFQGGIEAAKWAVIRNNTKQDTRVNQRPLA